MTVMDPKLIRAAAHYIRTKGLNEQQLADMRAFYKQSGESWPSSWGAITIRKVESDKQGRIYEVTDGHHRLGVARALRLDGIPVEIKTFATDADALLDQMPANLKHGSRLTVEERDAWIRLLCVSPEDGGMGMKQAAVAAAAGLSEASVSRIVAFKQRTGETGKRSASAKARKGKGRKALKEIRRDGFSPLAWYGNLCALSEGFEIHADLIYSHAGEVDPADMARVMAWLPLFVAGKVPPGVAVK